MLRPYSYRVACQLRFHPQDEALGLSASSKQYDVDDLGARLASELPYETAEETYRRRTGGTLSVHHMHERANETVKNHGKLDVRPRREDTESKFTPLQEGRFRPPVMMFAIDGASAPTRPEPSSIVPKRGKREFKQINGLRLYLIDSHEIVHCESAGSGLRRTKTSPQPFRR